MNEQNAQQTTSALIGSKVVAAFSSLEAFSCEFDNGTGLLIEAAGDAESARIKASVVKAEQLPRSNDAVCKVDWSWIYGSEVRRIGTTSGAARLDLDEAGPITISVQVWQGKPFLAFQPFRPAK